MKRILLYLSYFIFATAVVACAVLWTVEMRHNVRADAPKRIFIPSESSFDALVDTLRRNAVLKNVQSFVITSQLKSLNKSVKPGSYIIEPGMSNNQIVNILRAGRQAPVNVTFNNIRTLEELAGKLGKQIEADSASLASFLTDESNYSADGFTRQTIIAVFLPDTYQLYWTIDAKGFYHRMLREYRAFWNDERLASARALNLSPIQVSTLASIVDEESVMDDEKPRIAGVYLNRLRLGIPLQADPTIKFAINDFSVRRVLNEHKNVESPYNTYKYKGLPPGPVRCASKSGIEAVLKAENHDYLYFVARSDFSGYHHFSRTLAEHNRYANAYRHELNRRKIYE
jgi:UPF0755 protein